MNPKRFILNSRPIEILRILSTEPKTILEIAETFDVTDRTVRNDIKAINTFLSSKELGRVRPDYRGKLSVDLEPGQISTLLDRSDFYNFKLTKEERAELISFVLTSTQVPIQIHQLAEALYVSRSTLNNDLDRLRRELIDHGLELVPFSNRGIHADGSEENKRRYLRYLLSDGKSKLSVDQYDFIESFFIEEDKQFSSHERQILEKIIAEQLRLHSIEVTDTVLTKLKTYLEVMIRRNRVGAFINPHTRTRKSLLAKEIYELIQLYYDLPENEGEKRAIQNFVSALKLTESGPADKSAIEHQQFTREFIKDISEALEVNLDGDYELYESLLPLLSSLLSGDDSFVESNPIYEKIARENETLAQVVLDSLKTNETLLDRGLDEAVISNIIVEVCTALERKRSQQNDIGVVLVCHGNVITSRLLQQRLKKRFNLPNLKIQTAQDPIDAETKTLSISTVDLEDPETSYVKVQPVLADEDYVKICQRIEEMSQKIDEESRREHTDKDSENTLLEEINSVILHEGGNLYKMIENIDKKILDYLGIYQASNPRLYKLLTPEHIILDAEADTWQEAVRLAGNPLVENGVIDSDYIDKCIEMTENEGANMFVGEDVLLTYSPEKERNHDVGFTLVRLKDDIELDEGRSIRYICMMSTVDETKHLRALLTLGKLVQNPEYLEKLSEAATSEEVYDIIKDYDFASCPISSN